MATADTSDRTAVVILSDPESGGDGALGRTFNALALALDLDQAGRDVEVIFQGAGTRWPGRLADPTHPVNGLFEAVRHTIAGASCGCAQLFGAEADVTACGITLLTDNRVPGTSGVASLGSLIADGHRVVVF
jgi:hypothetical protein